MFAKFVIDRRKIGEDCVLDVNITISIRSEICFIDLKTKPQVAQKNLTFFGPDQTHVFPIFLRLFSYFSLWGRCQKLPMEFLSFQNHRKNRFVSGAVTF